MITHLLGPGDLALDEARIEGEAYRHLFRARRLAVGARLRLVDGRGGARWGKVVRVTRKSAAVALAEPAPDNEPGLRLELIVAAPRSERAAWLVEKATEIGVSSIRFVASERAPRKYGRASLDRLRRVASAALVQCHRSRLPEISGVDPWERVAEALVSGDRFLLDPQGADPASSRTETSAVTVLIGPEGGWSPAERKEFESLGCTAVRLGPRILRTETAAVVAAVWWLL